jgi:hypothetical protein
MDLGLGVSFDNPVFAGDFCQAFGLGLRAERFADLPVVAEGVEDAAYAPGVFGPYGADDRGSGRYGAVEGGVSKCLARQVTSSDRPARPEVTPPTASACSPE